MRIINSVAQLAQSIVGEGVQSGRVVKAGGEERRIGKEYQIGEVRGVSVQACRFSCF